MHKKIIVPIIYTLLLISLVGCGQTKYSQSSYAISESSDITVADAWASDKAASEEKSTAAHGISVENSSDTTDSSNIESSQNISSAHDFNNFENIISEIGSFTDSSEGE